MQQILITGKQGSGKSTLLSTIQSRTKHETIGFTQPSLGRDDKNERIGYDIKIINGESIPVARKNPLADQIQEFQSRPRVPRFIFYDEAFEKTRQILLKQWNIPSGEKLILIFDELGFLENEEGGHWPLLVDLSNKICSLRNCATILVCAVRKTLEETFATKLSNLFPKSNAIILDLDTNNNLEEQMSLLNKFTL
jgi:nucleoside-triphosphatase THEP1